MTRETDRVPGAARWMIFEAPLRTPGGKRDTNWIEYSKGSTPMIGGRCRPSAQGYARFGFASEPVPSEVIYVAMLVDAVYVLHAFQKKTRQTAERDVDLAASRLREQIARMR